MQILRQFYMNVPEREAVQAFMVETLAKIAVEKAFAGEDVSGLKDARELVDRVFDELELTYGEPKKKIEYNSR